MNNNLPSTYQHFIIFKTEDDKVEVDVRFQDETVWLTLDQMSTLFDRDKSTISRHIKNIFDEGELSKNSVVANFATTASDGKTYRVDYYNLDVIISVGYRVKSLRGTQFRQWATQRIKEYLIKGFTINTEYLKNPEAKDYFEELLKEIREIRASEKRFYAKIKDIYATSVDYDKTADVTREFFAIVQNKMLWAITGQTAAEIIHSRANADDINMGLTTWNGKKLLAPDVVIAKNYLKKDEMEKLDRLTVMYLDYAELQAERRIPMSMVDWATKLDGLLSLNEMEILTHKGKISKELAEKKAKAEYHKYDEKRRQQEIIDSDIEFAKEIEEIKRITKKNKE